MHDAGIQREQAEILQMVSKERRKMNQKKVKRMRKEFRETGAYEKRIVPETRKRYTMKDGKLVQEEYTVDMTINNFRKFKKEHINK